MESCRSEPLKFVCNKKIDINPKEYWEEIMQLTFLNNKCGYLSLTRLSYDEEIYNKRIVAFVLLYVHCFGSNFNK